MIWYWPTSSASGVGAAQRTPVGPGGGSGSVGVPPQASSPTEARTTRTFG